MNRTSTPTFVEFKNMIATISQESDRGSVLILSAWLDDGLSEFIKHHYIKNDNDKLFNYPGPLGSFSAKIMMAYSFGWLEDDFYSDLNLIRKIRNDFAHSRGKITFESEKIKDRINEFKTLEFYLEIKSIRRRFENTATMMILYLTETDLSFTYSEICEQMKNIRDAFQ